MPGSGRSPLLVFAMLDGTWLESLLFFWSNIWPFLSLPWTDYSLHHPLIAGPLKRSFLQCYYSVVLLLPCHQFQWLRLVLRTIYSCNTIFLGTTQNTSFSGNIERFVDLLQSLSVLMIRSLSLISPMCILTILLILLSWYRYHQQISVLLEIFWSQGCTLCTSCIKYLTNKYQTKI